MVLLHLALAGGRRVEADDIFVAAVGKHFAVNSLGAADGFLRSGAGSGGAVQRAFEGDADFVLVLSLLQRGIEQDADEDGSADAYDCADLNFAIWHEASFTCARKNRVLWSLCAGTPRNFLLNIAPNVGRKAVQFCEVFQVAQR